MHRLLYATVLGSWTNHQWQLFLIYMNMQILESASAANSSVSSVSIPDSPIGKPGSFGMEALCKQSWSQNRMRRKLHHLKLSRLRKVPSTSRGHPKKFVGSTAIPIPSILPVWSPMAVHIVAQGNPWRKNMEKQKDEQGTLE